MSCNGFHSNKISNLPEIVALLSEVIFLLCVTINFQGTPKLRTEFRGLGACVIVLK